MKQLIKPCGGSWGGENVDQEYREFLSELFGKHVWKTSVKTSTDDFMSVMKTFEAKKDLLTQTKI